VGGVVTAAEIPWQLRHGDCRDVLADMPDASVDSVVTDPPYELGFMGKRWDASGIAYDVAMWAEVLRVLKPGGHLMAFGGTRTYHRMACAIEDAGFEIRDSINWLYGSGFPKSLDVSKAIDKAAGAERDVVGATRKGAQTIAKNAYGAWGDGITPTAPATDAARRWDGWGTALKPAHEPIVVARKPLHGTVAANVLEHGTGALNIDRCRVGTTGGTTCGEGGSALSAQGAFTTGHVVEAIDGGRWPANVVLDPDAAATLNGQAEVERPARFFTVAGHNDDDLTSFRYIPKPDRTERNAGLDGLPKQRKAQLERSAQVDVELDEVSARFLSQPTANFHPTVKPLDLMRWLVRLVTPPDGTVLDPFAGSGTTIAAAILEGFHTIGIELTDDYLPIIEARAAWATNEARFGPVTGPTVVRKTMPGEATLFDIDEAAS
jgi:DNA modification methylase